MNKKINIFIKASLLTAGIACSAPAFSAVNGNLLAGGGLGYASSSGPSWLTAYGNVSYPMHFIPNLPQLAIEPDARLAIGLGDDNGVKLTSLISIAGKARYHISPEIDAYGGLSWNRIASKAKVCYLGHCAEFSGSGTELGIVLGGSYFISPQLGIDARLDLIDNLTVFNGGVVFKF